MADALISVVLEQVASILRLEIEQEVQLVVGVREEIENLSDTLTIIRGVLDDAEEKQVKNKGVKVWLEQLKDISYDADDVLDEWNTRILISQSQAHVGDKVCSYMFSLFSCFNRVVVRHDVGGKIRKINKRLDEIVRKKNLYNLTERQNCQEPRLLTSSFIDASEIFGRLDDKETIISKLLSESSHQDSRVPIISIVGTGGFGKTTLAQLILKEEEVITKFEKLIWVCVSEPFDLERVAKSIIEEAKGNVPNTVAWQALHKSLLESVKGKCFLLVLDDVWSSDDSHWRPLKLALDGGASGSRILVTTRDERVAKMIGSAYIHRLGQLSDDDSWSLFRHVAFRERQEDLEVFEEIGKEIARKCGGVPLAVRILASLMCLKESKQAWKDVLASDMWDVMSNDEDGFLPSLSLSYYALPSHLKQCFLYCAIFRKDEQIEKDELVKLWMAQGFLGYDRTNDLEKIGGDYFNDLAMRSFFQDFVKDDEGNFISCKIHDLLHDFAQSLTKSGSSMLKMEGREIGGLKFRHLSSSNLKSLDVFEPKNVCTLRPFSVGCISTVDLGLFQQLACLRALDLRHLSFGELPNEVERLLHLRYLDLSNTKLIGLPETVCNLFNMQTLKLNSCFRLQRLPRAIGKLSNLRHLEIEKTLELSYFPRDLGRLSCLRTLCKLIVGAEGDNCKIGELKLLNHLQGKLQIWGLGHVTDVNEAAQAELKKKENLYYLTFRFNLYARQENPREEDGKRMEGVLEALQPHTNLKALYIEGYLGAKFPFWMSSNAVLSNLVRLTLHDCSVCLQLPPLGRLASLEVLTSNNLESVKRIGYELYGLGTDNSGNNGVHSVQPEVIFPKLKKLEIWNLEVCEEWDIPFENDNEIFPNLCQLVILRCENLQTLPALGRLKSLEELQLIGLAKLKCFGLEFLGITTSVDASAEAGESAPIIAAFPELKKLALVDMLAWEEQEEMISGDNSQEGVSTITFMPCLRTLCIDICPKLKVVPHYMFSHALREIRITSCPQLTGMQPFLPPLLEDLVLQGDVGVISRSLPISSCPRSNYSSLNFLYIKGCPHSSLPEGFNQLTAIQTLQFDECEFLHFMPKDLKHLPMLQQLEIYHCPILIECCKKIEHWSTNSYIPKILLDLTNFVPE